MVRTIGVWQREQWTPARLRDLRDLLFRLRDYLEQLQAAAQTLRGDVDQLRADVAVLQTQANRAATVTELPAAAPFGTLIRLQGDLTGALYLGNGMQRPLTKLLPTVL